MAGLTDVLDISIKTSGTPVAQLGFGTPMIVGKAGALGSALVGSYASLLEMVTAGFVSTDAEYLAAQAIFAQAKPPPKVKIGRRQSLPTMRWKITPTAQNTKVYSGKIDNTAFTYTSDGTATLQEIIDGLKAAIDALGKAVTTSNQGPNTSLRILANTAGAFFQFSVDDPTLLAVEQDHADPGIAADLDAIVAVDNDFYGLVCTTSSTAEVTAIAAWVETKTKLYTAASQDTQIITSAAAGIAFTLKGLARKRSHVFYHPNNGEFADAALFGLMLPKTPGAADWQFKTLSGVAAPNYTDDQITKANGSYATVYRSLAGRSITWGGKTEDGSFIDQVIGRDWFVARTQERVYQKLADNDRIPFTDAGIAIVQAEMLAVMQEGVANGYIASSPAPSVTVPKAADVSSVNKQARNLTPITFAYTEAGAIRKVTGTAVISV